MEILFYCENDEHDRIQKRLRDCLPDANIIAWPNTVANRKIEYAVVWQPPDTFFRELPNLKAIFSLGAGVDHLLSHPELPYHVPLFRLEDAGMAEKMEEYVLYGVLHAQRNMQHYRNAQRRRIWAHDPLARDARAFHIVILGLGVLGQQVAQRLHNNGYRVSGWSRRPRLDSKVHHLSGADGLNTLLASADALVCLLPLTPQTRGLINRDLLSQCKQGCYLINVARGGHVITEDLLQALDSGQLSGALLDVTDPEPLPQNSMLWEHPDVLLTPHIAAPTQPYESVEQVVAKLQDLKAGKPVSGQVRLSDGY